jgi:hypothetical protein
MIVGFIFKSGIQIDIDIPTSEQRPKLEIMRELKKWHTLKQIKLINCVDKVVMIDFGEVAFMEILIK